ncbi:MAG: FIST C-terminal domain-containing protein [Bacteroidales bacterium]|nr:FIST C-terminal domain-containing protein [Bacteroidales bacterium]
MIRSYSFSVKIFGEFKTQLEQSLQHVDFAPTLAFAFVSSDFPLSDIMDYFKSRNIRLMGTTTAGALNFTPKEDQIIEKGGLFVLTNLNPELFHLESQEQKNKSWCDLGKETGKKIKKLFGNPAAIFFTGGLETDGHALTEGILYTAGQDLELYGSMAGDDLKFQHTYIFTETNILEKGIVYLVLDNDKIDIHGVTTSGWIGLGNEFTITSSKDNVIYEINHLSALDLYTSYLSISEDDLPAIGVEYPLMMKQSDETFATRMITGIDRKKRSIILSGSVPNKSKVSFSASPGFEILESTREKIIDFHSRYQEADFLLIFSGVARNVALGPLVTTEVKLAPIKWKVPLAGFFGYGETGKSNNGKSRFCNQTLTLILLKDNSSQQL